MGRKKAEACLEALLREVMAFPGAKALGHDLPAWEFGVEGRYIEAHERRKKAVLGLILESWDTLVLQYSEDPEEDEIPGRWQRIAPGHWIVPRDPDAAALYDWLDYGNWTIYKNMEEGRSEPWVFRTHKRPDEALNSMKESGVLICLYAFHDNNPWFFLVNPLALDRWRESGGQELKNV